MNFTAEQQKAILAPGNTLVLAGAGSGKTRTLVERCTRLLLEEKEPVSVREVLVVTFNEAAAAEVRERLRLRLEQEAARSDSLRVREQLALLDMAQISTLHSFCYSLLREHFYQLDLDPGVSVLDGTQAQVLFLRTIEELLVEHYAGQHPFSGALKEFIRSHLGGWSKPLVEFVGKLHEFTQTRPDPDGWFDRQLALITDAEPALWRAWFEKEIKQWGLTWAQWLQRQPAENNNAHVCATLLTQASARGDAGILRHIAARDGCWPDRKKKEHRAAFGKMFEEAAFLASLAPAQGDAKDPLREDWEWSRAPLFALLSLARQFAQRFAEAKQDRCVLDFHDLEQGALKLLWNGDEVSSIARLCQNRFKAVFVDEYQDINSVQDKIVRAVSRNNRFLVGDNKQSIYRFRQADPAIFQGYLDAPTGWDCAYLSENFRSHEGIIDFINPVFSWLMRKEVGGIAYDDRAALRFADAPARAGLKRTEGSAPHVELHLLFTDAESEPEPEENEPPAVDLENAEKEARVVADRLRQFKESGREIVVDGAKRPVEWRDMVVLLRSVAGKVEVYCKAFEAAGIPLHTKQNAFYTTQEVHDLCNVLHLLDNPLQDIPLAGVLRSPLCGMTANELAWIRIVSRARPLWSAVNEVDQSKQNPPGREKVSRFLALYRRWRGERSGASLAQRIERILADTGYDQWLLSQPRGAQRHANVQQLLRIARQFDDLRGESLYLFLRHIQELQEAVGDIEPASATHENAVRLMTVHQSKGLEFPVVAAPDLGKRFNQSDARASLVLDETFGICTMIKPPFTGRRYPSLPLWLARRHLRVETLGEEIRLMYVAFTRAQNHLLLFGSTTENRTQTAWRDLAVPQPLPQHLLKANSWLDWLGACLTHAHPDWLAEDQAVSATFSCTVHRRIPSFKSSGGSSSLVAVTEDDLAAVEQRLQFQYPHSEATVQPAKTSVSRLRKQNAEADEDAHVLRLRRQGRGDGRARGLAFHAFTEHLQLGAALDRSGLLTQADRMVREQLLSPDERKELNLESATAFWSSTLGREIVACRQCVFREMPFTRKLTARDIREAGMTMSFSLPEDEFVVLQGIIDLTAIHPDEIWLVDFKTDEIAESEVQAAAEEYRVQIALYASALVAIYKRPVTRKALYFVHPQRFATL